MEAILAGLVAAPVPSVLIVNVGTETRDEAVARFGDRYPVRSRGLLIVPKKPANDAEDAAFATRFKAQQLEIVNAVRRSYAQTADETPVVNAIYITKPAVKFKTVSNPWRPRGRRT